MKTKPNKMSNGGHISNTTIIDLSEASKKMKPVMSADNHRLCNLILAEM